MTTIVKAANAAQFLSLVPKMLGYRPTRSLVLIPFAGSRSIGAMRFDLPTAAESEEIDRPFVRFVQCHVEILPNIVFPSRDTGREADLASKRAPAGSGVTYRKRR